MDRTKECISFCSVTYCLLTFFLLALCVLCLLYLAPVLVAPPFFIIRRQRFPSNELFKRGLRRSERARASRLVYLRGATTETDARFLTNLFWFCVQCYSIIKGQHPRTEKPLRAFRLRSQKACESDRSEQNILATRGSQASIKPSMWGF